MNTEYRTFQKGFTLLEFLIALALMILLVGAALPLYGNLLWTTQLHETALRAVGDIRLARELSVARKDDSQYGVYLDVNPVGTDRLIFFRGGSYGGRNPSYDRVTTFSDLILLQKVLSGGGSQIVFSKNAGIPSATGTITITHTGSNTTRAIIVNAYGMVDSQ